MNVIRVFFSLRGVYPLERAQIVGILNFMADLLDLESDNPFRSRSYRSGARALEALTGRSRSTIKRAISELVEAGWMTSERVSPILARCENRLTLSTSLMPAS